MIFSEKLAEQYQALKQEESENRQKPIDGSRGTGDDLGFCASGLKQRMATEIFTRLEGAR